VAAALTSPTGGRILTTVHLLLLSDDPHGGKDLLPALEFLDHTTEHAGLSAEALGTAGSADLVLIDATGDLAAASHTCKAAVAADLGRPTVVVVDDGGLAALKASWGFDDWISPRGSPAEVETRLRIVVERARTGPGREPASVGDLSIDEDTYVVRVRGRPLDLTYLEFELLKFLAANPGRVFTRDRLLREVWGYDYYGGSRTVDVHIRRLRAKLGPEHEHMVGTVRGVGYKLDPPGGGAGLR
jgi:DNA-binding response OmpR family regulator